MQGTTVKKKVHNSVRLQFLGVRYRISA